MAVVYQHRRLDTNEIFYIGIGKTICRSKSKKNRNEYWHHIVEKHGYDVEILHTGISWEEACQLEMTYIKKYGRKDLGLGLLVNLTDGGEGMKNFSDITLKKMSDAQKGKKHSIETNSKKGIKGDNNPSKRPEVRRKISIANSNRTIDENTKKKISLTLSGENGIKSKLKNEDVLFIRKHYIKNHIEYGSKPLSIKYNVCARTIQSIIQRTRWKHI
jgi:hypothetical protein